MSKVGIIGAGPSGLSVALFLDEEAEILEKANFPGGHASSFEREGFVFDWGPHIMFSKNKQILEFMISSLGTNVEKCRRNNKISYKNRLIKYPFENDLKSLPLEDNFDCLKTYLFNPYKDQYASPSNLKEWLLKTFGTGICERYLFPYNEKVWNIPVDQLSMLWADRIPQPPVDDIIKSSIGYETEGYLHQLYYHYPKTGGYQALSEVWAKGRTIEYGFEVKKIVPLGSNGFEVHTEGSKKHYKKLVTTMPVHQLIDLYEAEIPAHIRAAVRSLIVNPMYVISLAVEGEDKDQYTAIYFPEPEFLVNRLSYPCTFSKHNAPPGHYSLQAEITCTADSDVWKMSDKEIEDHVVSGLKSRGLIPDSHRIRFVDVRRQQYSYVVYDTAYEQNANLVRDWFAGQGIELVGRFSFFEYVNVDMAIDRALKVTRKLNNKNQSDAELLARAEQRILSQGQK